MSTEESGAAERAPAASRLLGLREGPRRPQRQSSSFAAFLEPDRPLAERFSDAPGESRSILWDGHLASLGGAEAGAWIEAVAAVSPNDPRPMASRRASPLVQAAPPSSRSRSISTPIRPHVTIYHVYRAMGSPADFPP